MKTRNHQTVLVFGALVALGLFLLVFAARPTPSAVAAPSIPIHLAHGTFDPLANPPAETSLATLPLRDASLQLVIVQFNGPIDAAIHAEMAAHDVAPLAYVPYFSYIARVPANQIGALRRSPHVRWVGNYHAALRVDPALAGVTNSDDPQALIISLFADADDSALSDLRALGATVAEVADSGKGQSARVKLRGRSINSAAAFKNVAWIEPVQSFALNNSTATVITGVTNVWTENAARNLGLHGANQLIAIADSGIDRGSNDPALLHDDFEDGSGNSRIAAIYDRSTDGAQDMTAHGTHVAGTALGNGLRSGSDPATRSFAGSQAGVAPQARLVFQAIGRNDGLLVGIPFYLPWLYQQAQTPLADGSVANIHSNSWGIPGSLGLYGSYGQYTDQYVWEHPETLILFSAGNDGRDGDGDRVPDATTITSPATAKNVLSIGSTRNLTTNPNQFILSSGAGPTRDGRTKPDLLAPGSTVVSTASQQVLSTDYVSASGTSMATPHVAGAAALAREHFALLGHHHPSAALLKATLVNGAIDLAADPASGISGSRPNAAAGWGRLNLPASLGLAGGGEMIYWDSNAPAGRTAQPLQTGETVTYTLDVPVAGQPLRLTLAWSDYPATQATNGNLVNDLDLHLIAPDGTWHYPANANDGGLGGPYDHVNNVVGIDLASADAGSYQIVVRGFNVPYGPQPYAIVANAALTAAVDPNFAEMTISGPGQYVFGATGLTLDVTSATTATVAVQVVYAVPPGAPQPQDMLARHYNVTLTSNGARAGWLVANATFGYTDEEVAAVGTMAEHDIHVHYWNGQFWSTYPAGHDIVNNTVTINGFVIEDGSLLALGNYRPTAVTLRGAAIGAMGMALPVGWLWLLLCVVSLGALPYTQRARLNR